MKISFLGIGLMGNHMARRLCSAGHEVHAWNRTPEKAKALADVGARVETTCSEAAAASHVIISMLADGAAATSVLFEQGAANGMKAGSLFIDMSSIKPSEARDHAARLSERGIDYLDAPVSGGTIGAQEGSLAIMTGGAFANFERALPIFSHLGRATHVGPIGSGQLAKLANQMIVGITIGAVAEALLLCQKGGADIGKVRQAIMGGFADSRILEVHGQRMVERDFAPRGRISTQLKDLRNALATAHEIGFDAPITTLFESLNSQAVEHGLADLDHAGLFVELASRNALQ
jgi:3-hydroxyisobutyrate dehydrogenase-like beta-hydroxyacid dehydrogenase